MNYLIANVCILIVALSSSPVADEPIPKTDLPTVYTSSHGVVYVELEGLKLQPAYRIERDLFYWTGVTITREQLPPGGEFHGPLLVDRKDYESVTQVAPAPEYIMIDGKTAIRVGYRHGSHFYAWRGELKPVRQVLLFLGADVTEKVRRVVDIEPATPHLPLREKLQAICDAAVDPPPWRP